jgi:hypothetical protein
MLQLEDELLGKERGNVRYQGTNGPGLIGRLGRPIRVKFESFLRGQGILSSQGGEMYQSKQARD